NISATGQGSKAFADRLLQDFGVAALSGTAFGDHGEGFLRLSTANSEENLSKALERIAACATG
ncbi:MAG: aminotransferase class I/II-fold pyridoxal phosphate-dependent enzyme, partial [Chloroflexia bacterium]|nr:aminotransferase class I/II-fold pyridoxal phosphate-dependent enzyme [Chloroflexia bacterium]